MHKLFVVQKVLFQASTCFEHTCSSSGVQNCITQPLVSSHLQVAVSGTYNKLIVKQKLCASSWLITEINILRCTVSKTSKLSIRQLLKCIFNHISQLHVSVRPPGAIFIFLVCRMYLSAFTSKEVSFFFKLCLCFIYDSRVECVVFSWCYSLLLSQFCYFFIKTFVFQLYRFPQFSFKHVLDI